MGDILWFFIWNRIIASIFRNDIYWGLFMFVIMNLPAEAQLLKTLGSDIFSYTIDHTLFSSCWWCFCCCNSHLPLVVTWHYWAFSTPSAWLYHLGLTLFNLKYFPSSESPCAVKGFCTPVLGLSVDTANQTQKS